MANPHPLLQPAEPPDVMHKTRVVNFFDRRTPIIHQPKNGPCPLFAICNLLLLKGAITLEDEGEVSEKKMISLVADYLTKDMGVGHPCRREKNVNEALDLLPSLPKGIFMNFNFMAVDGFEFTRERALFDILDIPLYHGWIVDPQDTQTATAVGSKFNDDLASGLAKFESGKPTEENKHLDEETVDFADVTTAALRFRLPVFSCGRSFDELTLSNSALPEPPKQRGVIQEQDELALVLQLSKVENKNAVGVVTCDTSQSQTSTKLPQSAGDAVIAEQADKTEETSHSVDDKAIRWDLIKRFFLSNLTQISAHGICCLLDVVKDDQLCVLYCNYHFSTMFKNKGRLYVLANAEAFINESIVWTSLEVNGGEQLFTSDFALIKPEIPRTDLWKNQQAVSQHSLALSDYNCGGIPPCPTTDDKMSDTLNEQFLSSATGSNMLLTFDASLANDFLVKKEWRDLDDYLGKSVATVLMKTRDEVVVMHPGLFMIPRKEMLLDMLDDHNFKEAISFYQSTIELLRGCQGRFVPLDLMRDIEDLNSGVKRRSWAIKRDSAEEIGNKISGYIHTYFPTSIRRDDGAGGGLWQFAMRLPKPDKQGQDKGKTYYPFRCFLCGWVKGGKGMHSVSHLKPHFFHQSKETKSCTKITEDVLERLRAIVDEAKVPTFEYLKCQFSKKRKTGMVVWADTSKRPRGDKSRSFDSYTLPEPTLSDEGTDLLMSIAEVRSTCSFSLTSQLKPQLSTLPEPTVPAKVIDPLKLNEEIDAIQSLLTDSVIPCIDNRMSLSNLFAKLQLAAVDLRRYIRTQAQQPYTEQPLMFVSRLLAAAKDVFRSLTPDVVPRKEDRLLLVRGISVVVNTILQIW